jgi:tRNA U34 5-methylaminomethyl-2-thiouridine-forming methyltransferase MnmC
MSRSRLGRMRLLKTKDCSNTFFNDKVGDSYHSMSGAIEEAFLKHGKPSGISCQKKAVVFDVCFGIGYNSLAAISLFCGDFIMIYCFENDMEIIKHILEIEVPTEFENKYLHIRNFARGILEGKNSYEAEKFRLNFVLGDFREKIKHMDVKADIVFFDPFSPAKVPELWTAAVFIDVFSKMNKNSILTTYSCARKVRENMKEAGFIVKDGPIVGRRGPGSLGIKKI